MSEGEKGAFFCGAILGLVLGFTFSLFALFKGESSVRKEAIKSGAAVWIANENGDPVFKWKENK